MKPLTVTELARMGGKARAKKMTAAERSASARKAIEARWAKQRELVAGIVEGSKDLLKRSRAAQRRLNKRKEQSRA